MSLLDFVPALARVLEGLARAATSRGRPPVVAAVTTAIVAVVASGSITSCLATTCWTAPFGWAVTHFLVAAIDTFAAAISCLVACCQVRPYCCCYSYSSGSSS